MQNQPFGTSGTFVDIRNPPYAPYYDYYGSATSTEFFDFSARTDTGDPNTWTAEVALVQDMGFDVGTQSEIVSVLDDVQWGWTNQLAQSE